jgi:hypothetical protein
MNLQRTILDLAVEDYTGLWELVWRVRTVSPSRSEDEARSEAMRTTRQLIEEGLLDLYSGISFTGEQERLDSSDARAVLDNVENWAAAESGAPHYRIAATIAGEAAYRSPPEA